MSGFRSTSNVRLVLMLACGRGWASRARPRPVHRLCCEADLRSSSGGVPVPLCGGSGRASLIDQASVRLVVGQPPWAVEDRKPAIRVFVHAHGHLDEVMPVALLGNLKRRGYTWTKSVLHCGGSNGVWGRLGELEVEKVAGEDGGRSSG